MPMKWFSVSRPTPVLNTASFRSIFSHHSVPVDQDGHPPSFEFVALPSMCFEVLAELQDHILEIRWPEYHPRALYIDSRFGSIVSKNNVRKIVPLQAQEILQLMEKQVGAAYVWGGNWSAGIPEMLQFYPPSGSLNPRAKQLWTFHGLDCSGLLFEASGGSTPRNTSALVHFGTPLEANQLCHLDMIVYPGHVLFVRDSETIIESKSPFGVRIASLKDRLVEIQRERSFVRHWDYKTDPARSFTIRRFALGGAPCATIAL